MTDTDKLMIQKEFETFPFNFEVFWTSFLDYKASAYIAAMHYLTSQFQCCSTFLQYSYLLCSSTRFEQLPKSIYDLHNSKCLRQPLSIFLSALTAMLNAAKVKLIVYRLLSRKKKIQPVLLKKIRKRGEK